MRCLVVGGGGFIGSRVSNMLAEEGKAVAALGRTPVSLHRLSKNVKYLPEIATTGCYYVNC